MNRERRQYVRRSLQYSAWILNLADHKPIICEVTDVSSHGAHLVVEQPQLIPDTFLLSFSANGRPARPCRVVWRNEGEIGVLFATEGGEPGSSFH